MAQPYVATTDDSGRARVLPAASNQLAQINTSAVSWGAIMAGATTIAALSLILLMLGTGLGLSSISPWSHEGMGAVTFGLSTILWITITQLIASAMGGYLAGRLRTKWVAVHTDEVYFRDTAHGFLAWAIASLATAILLTSVIGAILNAGIQTGATVASGVARTAGDVTAASSATMNSDTDPMGYFVDSLFRKEVNATSAATTPANDTLQGGNVAQSAMDLSTSQVTRIFMNSARTGNLPAEDLQYVGQLVAQRTGLTQSDAEKRVTDTYARIQTKLTETQTKARDIADKARKASIYATLWLFISLLIGAFGASLGATYGGRQRDL